MIAGLLFATQDSEDHPGVLAATLPFGGLTVIEYQARLLIRMGAAQIIVMVARLTPELLGAIARIGRRGVAIDAVRTAGEAAAKAHPLSHVVMLADGLITSEAVLAPLVQEGADMLLTLDADRAPAGFERLGAQGYWAGAARLSPARLGDVATLPGDYDCQSALVRAAAQAGALLRPLPADTAAAGHGIERSAAALDARGYAVMAARLAGRRGWFDRWLVGASARPLLGEMMRRRVASAALAGTVAALDVAGMLALYLGEARIGLLACLFATIGGVALSTIAWLRDETALVRAGEAVALALPAVAALLLGLAVDRAGGTGTGLLLATGAVLFGGLDARASAGGERAEWQGGPGACLALVTVATLAGFPLAGLGAAAVYAAASLAAGIEALHARGLAPS